MKKLILVAVLLSGCKKVERPNTPPPIADGKCLADKYVGATAMKQSCLYVGYNWSCAYDAGIYSCDRGTEASGERVTTPVTEILGATK